MTASRNLSRVSEVAVLYSATGVARLRDADYFGACIYFTTARKREAHGEREHAAAPKDRQLVPRLHPARGTERRKYFADMPFAARLTWRPLGRTFAKECRSIYGTDPE
ncbi:hypothetical protein AB0J47_28200 [Nocardia sp. NPDC049737]|uniref:hypothetical protein n=1 Tax=Nocardia sp. NPDC049737 TaxID=3154358 RepID=UPI003431F0D0